MLDGGDVAAIIASSVGLSVLYGVAGVGIATLIRNPTTALIVGLSALYVISPLMSLLVPAWALPGGASEIVGLGAVTPQATQCGPQSARSVATSPRSVLPACASRYRATSRNPNQSHTKRKHRGSPRCPI